MKGIKDMAKNQDDLLVRQKKRTAMPAMTITVL